MKVMCFFAGCLLWSMGSPLHSRAQISRSDQTPEPVFFHISHHQEDVGRTDLYFPKYERFKEYLKHELEMLDAYGVVSDQCFSDFIVSVILYMQNSGRDPSATEIFRWFNESSQNLGYHFHPTSWDINIRLDKIRDLDLGTAILEYTRWEQAYYDWTGCTGPNSDSTRFCGALDLARPGGIGFMQQYFTKPVVNECLTLLNPAAGQVIRNQYGSLVPVIGQAGSVHPYYTMETYENLWMSDWMFSAEPGIYVYKMMGLLFTQNRSEAWAESQFPAPMLKQVLANLPRDIPHFFAIHVTIPPVGEDPLEDQLEYLTKEFLPANPGSRFISSADIPELIVPNPLEFSMEDLEQACLYVLSNWHGRPPAFARFGDHYLSLASLFKALQSALVSWSSQPAGLRTAAQTVLVPEFILPPLGRESALPNDGRLATGFSSDAMISAVRSLPTGNSIPYTVEIPSNEGPGPTLLRANAAEFLKAMCTLFLQLRKGNDPGILYVLPSYIIPVSNLPVEAARNASQVIKTNMEWIGELQLWTAEPVRLKNLGELSGLKNSGLSEVPDFELSQNYPNPFEGSTSIRFRIARACRVNIRIFDILGKEVQTIVDRDYDPGWHDITWAPSAQPGDPTQSHLYFYRMVAGDFTCTRKAMSLK